MVGYDLVRNDLRRQRNPPVVRSDRGRNENANRDAGRGRGERDKASKPCLSCARANALIFPLRTYDLKKPVRALEGRGATSPGFFDKKRTKTGRKGKLARGRTKGARIPSWKAVCQAARNASKKPTSENEIQHAV